LKKIESLLAWEMSACCFIANFESPGVKEKRGKTGQEEMRYGRKSRGWVS
jgi:hypothetical protein